METRNANRILPGAGVLRSSAAMTRHQEISDEDVVAQTHPVEGYQWKDDGEQLPNPEV